MSLNASPGYLGFHANGPIEGGWQVFESWTTEADNAAWVEALVVPNVPEGLFGSLEVTVPQGSRI